MAPLTIPLFKVSMDPSIGERVSRVLLSGYIAQGPRVDEFEDKLESWMGRRPIALNSGTSALTMAMRLAGVGHGSVVITTPMTCSATNLPILSLGAHICWADIDPRTGLIDPTSVKDRVLELRNHGITPAAIVAVDWGGQPADYDAIRKAAPGIPIIEDAAHAFGAWYKEDRVGSVADYTCFSFQAIKHLTTGDGGALVVPPEQVIRARNMRWFGIDRDAPSKEFRGEVDIEEWGYKFHMNDVAAEIGLANERLVTGVLAKCRANAATYDRELKDGYTRTAPEYEHVGSWWMYTMLLPTNGLREQFKRFMPEHGVQVSQVHWRNDTLTVFKDYQRSDLRGVDEFSSRMVCLPTHWQTRVMDVVDAANKFL